MEHDYRNQKNGLSDSYGYLGKCRTEYARFFETGRFFVLRGRVLIAFGLVKQLNINAINKCNLFVVLVFYGA